MATVHSRWRRALLICGAALALTVVIASACGDMSGPHSVQQPDDSTNTKKPNGPEDQGFLLQPAGGQGFLV
jgi:hypothetical protein